MERRFAALVSAEHQLRSQLRVTARDSPPQIEAQAFPERRQDSIVIRELISPSPFRDRG